MMASKAKPKYEEQYLTIEMLEAGTQCFKIGASLGTSDIQSVSYSLDNGKTWTETANVASTVVEIETPTIEEGGKVLWRGTGRRYATYAGGSYDESNGSKFVMGDKKCIVYGNLLSMLYGENYSGKTGWGYSDGSEVKTPNNTSKYGLAHLFSSCTGLQSAENLVIPMAQMAHTGVAYMFSGCSSLTKAPSLPCTSMASYCYSLMFYLCSALVSPPSLPATTLEQNCYSLMFYGCSALEAAPVLPATTLVSNCYQQMFQNCTKLSYIKAMFTTTPSTSYCSNWVNNVAANGTFVKSSSAEWDVTGSSGIPSGWTVEAADS